jgi:hypothetical protein
MYPVGGRFARAADRWLEISSNQWVHRILSEGLLIEWEEDPPPPLRARPFPPSDEHAIMLDAEIQSLLAKDAIELCQSADVACLSSVFFVPKKGGQWRLVVNLKPLNQFVEKEHFQMEGLKEVRDIIRPNDWMFKLDFKDAYFHVPIHPRHRHYLAFEWRNVTYQYKALPFGLTSAPRIFSKLMAAVAAFFRAKGIRLVFYLDDWLFFADSRDQLLRLKTFVLDELLKLGFTIHWDKSLLEPTQIIEFLGVTIDSAHMQFQVPRNKVRDTLTLLHALLKKPLCSPREMAQVIGKLNSLNDSVLPTRRRYRTLQIWKTSVLEGQNWDQATPIPTNVKDELQWWLDNLEKSNGRGIIQQPKDVDLYTDASGSGWGATLGSNVARGSWDLITKSCSNNVRELKAILMAVRSFLPQLAHKVVQVHTDNTTALAYVNHMGGREPLLTSIAGDLWDICFQHHVYLQAEYIPGAENIDADYHSRFIDRNDWKLNPDLFHELDLLWGPHDTDLFASALNAQLPRFFAWNHDPAAAAIDAFQQSWKDLKGYANPPFCLIGRILHKLRQEQATITLVAPIWTTAHWFPDLLAMTLDRPFLLPDQQDLFLPGFLGNETPLNNPAWRVAAWRVSGNFSAVRDFQMAQPNWFSNLGSQVQGSITTLLGDYGLPFANHTN